MRRSWIALQGIAVALALAALVLPLPPATVERYYAGGIYPSIQTSLTAWSNTSAIALFDPLVVLLGSALAIYWARTAARMWRARSVKPAGRPVAHTLVAAALLYLWFAVVWGFNYARTPLEARIGYDPTRITVAALRSLTDRAIREANESYAAAHGQGFPAVGDTPPALVAALHDIDRRLGRPRPTTPGRPKRTMFAFFFRSAGVDGMHAPFLLETLLNPDLTPPERPAVLAHEWAHLSGHAPEADASFVGLLAALHADDASRYSAWLSLVDHTLSALPRSEHRTLTVRLAAGPTADRRAIVDRLTSRVEVVAEASWRTYDSYLKAQGVDEGVESYGRVVDLLLGSGALDWQIDVPR